MPATQAAFDLQLEGFLKDAADYWSTKFSAQGRLRRIGEMLNGTDITTGDPMRDYCLMHWGLHYGPMEERYRAVNEVLKGHTGELVLTHRTECPLPGVFNRHFKMGILIADTIDFAYKHNCMLPVNGYVTSEDISDNPKMHPSEIHERGEYFIASRPRASAGNDFMEFVGHIAVLDDIFGADREHPRYRTADVVAGTRRVRAWFNDERQSLPNGSEVCRRLEQALRSSKKIAALAA